MDSIATRIARYVVPQTTQTTSQATYARVLDNRFSRFFGL